MAVQLRFEDALQVRLEAGHVCHVDTRTQTGLCSTKKWKEKNQFLYHLKKTVSVPIREKELQH